MNQTATIGGKLIVTLGCENVKTRYRISPMGDGLNFIIQRTTQDKARSKKEIVSEWSKPIAYASTLDHALSICLKKILLEDDTIKVDVISFQKKAVNELTEAFNRKLSSIKTEVSEYEQDAQTQGDIPECTE